MTPAPDRQHAAALDLAQRARAQASRCGFGLRCTFGVECTAGEDCSHWSELDAQDDSVDSIARWKGYVSAENHPANLTVREVPGSYPAFANEDKRLR